MKKIAVLFLCLALLLSGCAVSSIAPGQAGVRYGLGGLKAAANGETVLDLIHLNAVLEAAKNDTTAGARLYIENEGQVYAELIVTADSERVAIVANGQSSGSKVYTITDPDTVQAVTEVIDSLTGEDIPDFENMTDEEWEEYWAQMQEQLENIEIPEMTEEEMQAGMEQAEKLSAIMDRCFTEAEPMDLDGVTYEGTAIHADEADVAELLRIYDMAGAADSLEKNGLGIDLSGSMYYSMEGGAYTEFALRLDVPGSGVVDVHATADETVADQSDITVEAMVDDAPLAAVALTMLNGGIDEAPWLDVDLSEAVDLTGMTDEELANELVMVMGSLGGQAAAGLAIAAMNDSANLFD